MWWDHVAHALQYLDYSSEVFDIEIMAIFEIASGYSRQDLLNLPFDQYNRILEEVKNIHEMREKKARGLSNTED